MSATLIAAGILWPQSASALTTYRYPPDGGGYGYYNDSTGIIGACDTKSDGHGVYTWWNYGANNHSTPTNRVQTQNGNGTCAIAGVPGQSTWLSIRTCTDKAGEPDSCSGWLNVRW